MATTKSSRNAQRKKAYADQADKSSRNQIAIEGPIIGRFVTVDTEESVTVKHNKDGESQIITLVHKLKKPRQVLVHDGDATPVNKSTDAAVAAAISAFPRREPNAQKRRRQQAAWTRCAILTKHGEHDFGGLHRNAERDLKIAYPADNCVGCGCPKDA